MLEIRNIRYLWKEELPVRGIKNVSFKLNRGEILGILGKSGSGKSTLALCICGLLDLQKGEVLFNELRVQGPSEQLIPGHPDIALLRQDIQILENHTVLENLRDVLTGFDEKYKISRTHKLLKIAGLIGFEHQKAKVLSQGQKQRLSLARTLIQTPQVLVLDEPFNHLDFEWKFRLTEWILEEQKKHGFSIIWITHDYSEVLKYCQRVVCLHNGIKAAEGIPIKIFFNPKSKLIASLFGPYHQLMLKNKKVFLRPRQVQFSEKKTFGSVTAELLKEYFNGYCFEYIFKTKDGDLIISYSDIKISSPKKGYLTFKINP